MRQRGFWCLCLLSCCFQFVVSNNNIKDIEQSSTDVAHELDERLLLFVTLDGTLVAIEQQTGKIKWKIKDKPIVQVPLDTSDAINPIFLPDPRDGSLYLLGNSREPLKKLPFTISQLVASSPCRSSDGILYTGKKKDMWYKLDPENGNKQLILGWDAAPNPTCPLVTNKYVFIGRTKYEIMMVDSRNPFRKWNVTYYDYTASPMSKDQKNNYDLVHFASTSSGRLITMDRRRGNLLWDGDVGSPVVAAYLLDSDGLIMAPFTSLANHTISYLATQLVVDGIQELSPMKLYPTLYVGEHLYGLYAIPSLVDQNVVTITASEDGPLLLGGPHAPDLPRPYPEYPLPGHNYKLPKNLFKDGSGNFQSVLNLGNHIVIFTGHYNTPEYSDNSFTGVGRLSKPTRLLTDESHERQKAKVSSVGVQTERTEKNFVTFRRDEKIKPVTGVKYLYNLMKLWLNQQENKEIKIMVIILTGCVIALYFYMQAQVQYLTQNGSQSSQQGSYGRNGVPTTISEELPDGLVRVGKITFSPEQLLGKGCEGTFVYRGEFDNRRVAVKRLLPECFTFADREVALLRESDAHPNVIRYYCTEQDRMFRYIALELCQATLSEYIQGKCDTSTIGPLDILQQATSGLAHLHALDIVHRDIKPHNVLLSVPDNRGQVRAMISDFGLCKKLQFGRASFSRRSGVTGTDGWIAPEMLHGNERTTCAVDLFSLGCLFYYVLSQGAHPFGDALRRQANILNNEWNLTDLQGAHWQINIQIPLISALISSNPRHRPPCSAVLAHPIFWNSSKILSFFQDVSDRVEKAELDDVVLQALENNGEPVVRSDWRFHIHEEVAKDLRKYRTYRGESVRDLLRALRNKKHHFRELTQEAQDYLGEIPEAFTLYWTMRFPLLLAHAWISMQCVANEKTFKNYYHQKHHYSLYAFRKQVANYTNDNPVELPQDVNIDHFTKEYKKSPRRGSPKVFGERRPRIQTENVGLYRNLQAVKGQEARGESYPLKRFGKKKKASDEPLKWAIKDSDNN